MACPLCRQTIPVPKSKAAGFPNNVAILDMLAVAQSQVELIQSTCTQHNKVISVFCSTCQEGICVSCMLKSPKHKGHDMEELSEAMERCIHQSQGLLKDIIQTVSTIQDNIKQKAQAKNPQCLQLLCQLQKYKECGRNAAAGDIDHKAEILRKPFMITQMSTENTVEQASLLAPVDGFLQPPSLSQSTVINCNYWPLPSFLNSNT